MEWTRPTHALFLIEVVLLFSPLLFLSLLLWKCSRRCWWPVGQGPKFWACDVCDDVESWVVMWHNLMRWKTYLEKHIKPHADCAIPGSTSTYLYQNIMDDLPVKINQSLVTFWFKSKLGYQNEKKVYSLVTSWKFTPHIQLR